jgi:hypothetical protein
VLGRESHRIDEWPHLARPDGWYAFWQESHELYTRGRTSPVAPATYSNPLWDIKSSLAIEGSLCLGVASWP